MSVQEQDSHSVQQESDASLAGIPWHFGRNVIVGLPLLLALFFYLPLWLGVRTFPDGDFTHHFLPFSLFQRAALAAGQLPLWNPYTYGGHPFLADIQAAAYYPISNLLLLATLPVQEAASRLYLLQVEAIAHVALAGIFCGLLVDALTGNRAAGLVAAISFAFSSYLTGYPPLQLAVLRTAVWLPLLLWLVVQAWMGRNRLLWWAGAGIASAAAFLAGHPQTFLYIVYALAAWVVFLGVLSRRQRGQLVSGLAGAAFMGCVALGLSAAQWLPSLEFLRLSVRADVSYDFVSGGFPLQDMWQLLLPGVLTQFSPLYIGIAGLQLALCAVIWAVSSAEPRDPSSRMGALPWRAGVAYFMGMALIGLLASFGDNGPLYALLYRAAPGWDLFRGQERAAYWVAFGLAVSAGYGVALMPRVADRRRRRAALWTGAVTVAGVYAFGLLWQMSGRSAIGNGHYLLIAAGTLVAGMATSLMIWLPNWSRRRTLMLLTVAAVTLFAANMGTNLDAATPNQKVQVVPEVAALQAAVAERTPDDGIPGRVYNEYRVYDDYGMRAQVEDVWGSSPLRLARYAQLFDQFPLDRMWRLLGVEHVLTWRRELFGPSELLGEFPQAADTTYLHRLPDAGKRAWLVNTIESVADDVAWSRLGDHQVNLDEMAFLAPEYDVEFPGASATPGTVRAARVAPNRLRLTVQGDAPGFLIVAENWMPGWRVDNINCEAPAVCTPGRAPGELLQPVRANLTLLGVPIPAGKVTFDLVYAPNSVRMGQMISGGVLLLLLATVGVRGMRSRQDGA